MTGLIIFGSLLIGMFMGLPVCFALLAACLIYLIPSGIPLTIVPQTMIAGMNSFVLLAIPLFTMTGYLMEQTSLSRRLVDFVEALFCRSRGSMGVVTIVTCAIFAALTGSGPATVAAIGAIMMPALTRANYPKSTSAGMIAAGGALGPIIPPSANMVVYGAAMGLSVSKMFIGGVLPGIMMAVALCLVNVYLAAKYKFAKSDVALPIARQAAPLLRPGQFYLDMNTTSPQTKREIAAVFADSQGDFVEGAVMASVPVNGSRVPVSVCGAKAKEAAELLNSHGMKFTYLSDDIGLASATKALRSVLAKGIIALVTETVFATDHYHITEEVLDKMKVTMFDERGFMGFCHYCVASAAIHNGRFCHEMEEVLKTLDDLGENSIMTQATLKKFEWLQQEGYAAYFPERAKTYDEVLAVKKMLDEKKGEKANV